MNEVTRLRLRDQQGIFKNTDIDRCISEITYMCSTLEFNVIQLVIAVKIILSQKDRFSPSYYFEQ